MEQSRIKPGAGIVLAIAAIAKGLLPPQYKIIVDPVADVLIAALGFFGLALVAYSPSIKKK